MIHKLLDSLRLCPLVVGESLHFPTLFPALLRDSESLSLWAILVGLFLLFECLFLLLSSFSPFSSSLSLLANARTSLVASHFIRICKHLQKVIFEAKCTLASSAVQQKKTCREKRFSAEVWMSKLDTLWSVSCCCCCCWFLIWIRINLVGGFSTCLWQQYSRLLVEHPLISCILQSEPKTAI